ARTGSGGPIFGTVAYMAPEHRLGHPMPPSDCYATGMMLYEALTGRPPSSSASGRTTAGAGHPPAPPWEFDESVPDDLEALCVDLLKPDPKDRPQSADIVERLGTEGRRG